MGPLISDIFVELYAYKWRNIILRQTVCKASVVINEVMMNQGIAALILTLFLSRSSFVNPENRSR